MAAAIREPETLLRALDLSLDLLPGALAGARKFSLFVPLPYLERMIPGDPQDPLLRQVLPLEEETLLVPGYAVDPLEEEHSLMAPGLLQKYPGRALLVTTGVCAVHCRYCFRRHYPYQEGAWKLGLEKLRGETHVEEVLLSGGDPLAMAPGIFRELILALDTIPHLQRLRVHTRLPIVLPARVDEELLELLGSLRLPIYLVVHANHARELSPGVALAAKALRGVGVILLNQSVLLRGVNDSLEALEDLSRGLVNLGIIPYYLHLLDPIQGAAHFEVSEERGRSLHAALRERLPGYGVPVLVREKPGAKSKIPV
jgi:EF-P beta-lysylation protein EpmB